jgi:hypothetical protein
MCYKKRECVDKMNKWWFEELANFEKIYVLVSGGFDSTWLYIKIREIYLNNIIYPVNCYNPYEWNDTLKRIEKEDPHFIKIYPGNYKDIIKKSFLNLPKAYKLKENKKYHKKIFPCCNVLKHKSFKKDARFLTPNSVIVSGIKWGDGKQRRIWLSQLHARDTFFHRHKTGHLYYYPFRDYTKRELTDDMKNEVWKKYPNTEHSGCSLCPILVLFNIYGEGKRYERSLKYAENLGVLPYIPINKVNEL